MIDSQSLYRLFPNRSKQVISRRLRKLWEGEYLDRPISQNRTNSLTPGSDYLVYALAREGARELRDKHQLPISPERWTQKNSELKPLSIAHHMSTTRFTVAFATDAWKVDGARMRYADEVLPGKFHETPSAGLKYIIQADAPWHERGMRQGTAPDEIIGLDYAGERQVLFIEIDQGTETIEPGKRRLRSPTFWTDTSFLRKMLIYSAAFRAGAHKKRFGIPAFRVVTVTTNAARVEKMVEAYEQHLSSGENRTPAGLFLFTDWENLSSSGVGPVQVEYINGAGRLARLI